MHFASCSWAGSSGIKNFKSRDFRDGILQYPGIPGFFGLIHPILWQVARASGCSVLLAMRWPKKEPASHQKKVETCVIVKSNLGLLRDLGFRNKWEVNVWLTCWFLFASQNQWILVHVEYWLLKNQKFGKMIFDSPAAVKGLKTSCYGQ